MWPGLGAIRKMPCLAQMAAPLVSILAWYGDTHILLTIRYSGILFFRSIAVRTISERNNMLVIRLFSSSVKQYVNCKLLRCRIREWKKVHSVAQSSYMIVRHWNANVHLPCIGFGFNMTYGRIFVRLRARIVCWIYAVIRCPRRLSKYDRKWKVLLRFDRTQVWGSSQILYVWDRLWPNDSLGPFPCASPVGVVWHPLWVRWELESNGTKTTVHSLRRLILHIDISHTYDDKGRNLGITSWKSLRMQFISKWSRSQT